MKFLHLGDLHLGKTVNEFQMLEDQRWILEEILKLAEENAADAILVAGDIYDRTVPSEEAVGLLDWLMRECVRRRLQLLMISGNHDSDERLHFGSSIFSESGIYIAGKYQGRIPVVTLEDEYGPVNFHLLPFVKASHVRHYYPEEDCSTYELAVQTALRHRMGAEAEAEEICFPSGERNVLLAHQFVAGSGGDPELGGSEISAVNVGTVEKISAACFDAFDYVALGHIHRGQQVGRETVRYAGSPLKYSLREIGNIPSVPLITMTGRETEVRLLPLHPRREMRRIRGEFRKLLEAAVREPSEDYFYVTLTDEIPVTDALRTLREYYPAVMKLDYDNSRTRGNFSGEVPAPEAEKSFEELVTDFYREMTGAEPDREEMEILAASAKEAGIQ